MTTATLTRPKSGASLDEVEPVRVRMTLTDFLALDDDPTIDRELVAGILREHPMTAKLRAKMKQEFRRVGKS